jgi:hypothetical protein
MNASQINNAHTIALAKEQLKLGNTEQAIRLWVQTNDLSGALIGLAQELDKLKSIYQSDISNHLKNIP